MAYELAEATCDGLDNDCDGNLDESIQPPLADVQNGVCSGAVRVCAGVDGFIEPDYAEINDYQENENTCDGLDNDCDGTADEGVVLPPADRTEGVCAGAVKVCAGQAGFNEPDYTAIAAYEVVETTCDGLDNDCDGNVDEGVVPPLADNQNGVCAGTNKTCGGAQGFIEPDYTALAQYNALDVPDDLLDTNCDGVVGIRDELIYLSPLGDDFANGLSPETPVRSMTRALAVAGDFRARDIALATGQYNEARTIVPLNGVSIYGGFGDGFTTQTNNKSSLTSTASPAIRVAGFDSETRIDGLSVTVTARAQASEESVGLVVADSGDFLRVSNSTFTVNSGGDGTDGADGANGADGGRGSMLAGAVAEAVVLVVVAPGQQVDVGILVLRAQQARTIRPLAALAAVAAATVGLVVMTVIRERVVLVVAVP